MKKLLIVVMLGALLLTACGKKEAESKDLNEALNELASAASEEGDIEGESDAETENTVKDEESGNSDDYVDGVIKAQALPMTFTVRKYSDGRLGAALNSIDEGIKDVVIPSEIYYDGEASNCEVDGLAPEGVYEINNIAWSNGRADGVESIEIPGTISTMQNMLFENNTSLKKVVITEGMYRLGAGTFRGCSNLQEVVLPNTLVEISEQTFMYCTSLQSITIPGSVEEILEGAFQECTSLKEVIMEEGVKRTGNSAFMGCSALESITFPEGFEKVGDWSFSDCVSLKAINLSSTVAYIEQSAFNNTAIEVFDTTPVTGHIRVDYALTSCPNLREVILTADTYCVKGFTSGSENLQRIYYPGTEMNDAYLLTGTSLSAIEH